MRLNIRERCQKVSTYLRQKAEQSVREIARATGMAKSSVHRHLKAIRGRQQYPESFFWETEEGAKCLRLLVFAAIYCFGIKGGVGSESLSNFFHLLHLERHVGCSATALRKLEVQMKEQIIAYEKKQAEACANASPIDICLGADETFYDLPILVAIELVSGFIFSEAKCENRTYERWQALVSEWYQPQQWRVRVLVSDGAKALVKLALSGLGCPSVPDVFHLLYGVSKSMGAAIERQRVRLHKQQQAWQAKLNSEKPKTEVAEEIQSLQGQQQTLETDQQQYQQSLQALSQAIHPFEITTSASQIGGELASRLQPHFAILERLSQTYAQNSQAALKRFQRQIPALGAALDAWWHWTLEALHSQTQDPDTQNWVLTILLPWVYWHQQTQKTRQTQLKQAYHQATQRAHERLLNHPFTHTCSEQQQWIEWATWMCAKFQRTSSAVEGRNGYLSALHHANRGFTEQTLQVLTIIHNFDLQRSDGSTAAQRLFGKPFPSLFEFVVLNMGELPRPRQSRKPKKSQTPTLQAVPL